MRSVADILCYTQQGVGLEVAFLYADVVKVNVALPDVRLRGVPQANICGQKVKHRHLHIVVAVELERLAAKECLMVLVLEFHVFAPFLLVFWHKKSTHRFFKR